MEVSVVIILKTGQKMSLKCFSFERIAVGYSFTSYPEERGFKTVQIVKDEIIGSISITAPEPLLAQLEMPPLAAPMGVPSAPAGQVAPRTTLSAFNRLRTEDGSNRTVPVQDKEAPPGMGRPKSMVNTYDESGKERPLPVDAAMI